MSDTHVIDPTADPETRMRRLCQFVEFWLGKRKASYGAKKSALKEHAIPEPLESFYRFAGRWPRRRAIPSAPKWNHAFAWQDCLRPVEFLTYDEDGRVVFADENQGVWELRTLSAGKDPEVWLFGDSAPDGKLISDSLTNVLVSLVLQELLFGSAFFAGEYELKDSSSLQSRSFTEIWNGPLGDSNPRVFQLSGNLLAATIGDRWYGSNDPSFADLLPINASG